MVGDGRAEVLHTFGTERRAERTGTGEGNARADGRNMARRLGLDGTTAAACYCNLIFVMASSTALRSDSSVSLSLSF